MLNQAFEDGISTCQEQKKKYFYAPSLAIDSIYLTKDEIEETGKSKITDEDVMELLK